ncbi:3-oxoacyl-[acyl-carrier protein] reductase [Actinoalloteichus hoggarensis]|uniref:3-oxoacyl-[acyl-carrier-protein] reductase FabG n=1 Tax=Actinoalloteichus hoggarensis TaxID=1470176 RepID=A0A221W2L8_9PSEU|nr:SDR family oxidoreductase [Actinoalloteichus hoggarensis]ASO20015.1 3-oxoacyl-[acyl-carrier-protein] reductase FabG [Actinoalloteichus hoggarensis]MBB5919275.1 3-oxoacyl-[acyl-carrier protein] reductase [Actinoalloteichus hoggarensis]
MESSEDLRRVERERERAAGPESRAATTSTTAEPAVSEPAVRETAGGADGREEPLGARVRASDRSGRVALVTGASRGLGAAIAEALARNGLTVAINFVRDEAGAREVRRRIRAEGGTAEVFRADVTDEARVAELCRAVRETLGPVDVLVLNATGSQPAAGVEDLSWQDMLDQLEFFVKSPLLLAKEVIPGMRERGYGRIVNIGSEVVELGVPESSAYVAAKAAQLGLTRSWARELAPHGITVNLVAPGWIPTERHGTVTEESARAYTERVPMGRFGLVEEVGTAVAHLASAEAGFITGQRLAVNGGNTLT